ncbi:hypothetical protein A5482_012385 [Cyanobacterium sp. IPPAS B-1200]|uniref:hypothetical protein n=1 Tax=Cyanobacterium sp. IPPAS B-1200 TaxID=1562720 RepID=UPI0008524C13|nr:hypothetical protein [Cyanobacterium sp. IPPAS B-1200]OEJ77956.1 hypothetical protein A5482_03830 [Cyanobacterium sp. IPPAS B-1200]
MAELEFKDINFALGGQLYLPARMTKRAADFIDFDGLNDVGRRESVLGTRESAFIQVNAQGDDQLAQRSKAVGRNVAGLRVFIPLKDKIPNTKNAKRAYIAFPKKNINLIYVATALHNEIGTAKTKIKPFKGLLCFKVVGGGWHQIAAADLTVINRILDEDKEAQKKGRESTTTDLDSEALV